MRRSVSRFPDRYKFESIGMQIFNVRQAGCRCTTCPNSAKFVADVRAKRSGALIYPEALEAHDGQP